MKLLKTQFVISFWLLLLVVMPLTAVAGASIGVAKKADATGRQISFVITIENLGDEALNDLTLSDDLDTTFGAGNYSITSMPNLVSGSGITFNSSYDGSGDAQIIDSGSLAVGELVKIGFDVSIETPVDMGSGLGIYSNQASVSANSGTVTDVSDWGEDPDPNGNGDATEAGENDPTEVSIVDNPIVGVSLTAAVSGSQVTFDYYIENLGNAQLSELALINDLDNVFGAGNYSVISAPSFIQDSGTITLNAGFDGSANQNIINTSSSLNIGALSQIRLVVDVTTTIDQGMGDGVYAIQAQAQGQSYYGKVSTDLSSNSNEPSQSINENTVFTIGESAVIGVALTSSVTGNTVTYDYYLENLGNVDLESLDLVNDLNAVFGVGNYFISQAPSFIDNPGSITLNENFDGNFNTKIISVGTLATADTAQIRLNVELLAISDQGSGDGIYQNQASISAQSSGGALTNDLSDSGTDPDPNGNGDPAELGENDVTQSIITEETVIGVSLNYSTSVIGGFNYIDLIYTVENLGNTTVSNITIESNLDNVFGAGNYAHVLDPSEVSGAGTFNFNASYNGNTNKALLNAGSTLAPSEKVIFKTQSRIVTESDQGNGLGVYQHQVTLNATDPDVNPVSDISVSGDTPDANGNGDPSDDLSVTTIDTNISRQVGLAIDAAVVGNQVTLDYYIENLGNAEASGFSLTNSLDTLFGGGNYTLNSFNLVDDPTTLDLNLSFDGSFDLEMLDTSGSLAAGDTAQLQVVVTINKVINVGLGLGNYSTQLTLNALNVNSPVSDLSDFGTDADPNGNSDPTEAGENDATTFSLGGLALVGAALDVTTTANQATFDVYLENFTADNALNLALPVDLDVIFGSGNYTINQLVFISDPGTITLNNGSFDGSTDTALISANSSLAGNATAQIQLVVDISNKADNFDLGVGAYQAQFEISTTSASNITTSDLTDSSTDPDDNANNDPSDSGEDDITSFTVSDTGVVGVAVRSEVSGSVITYTVKVENFSDTTIDNVLIQQLLNPVFGASNYSVTAQPTLIGGEGTLILNTNYFGLNTFTQTIVAGGTLAPKTYSEFTFSVNVSNVTDQGNGIGVYHLQLEVDATDIAGTAISDFSDSGSDPDPNGNNDPTEVGENDTTITIIGDEANVGVSTTASVVGNLVTLDYYIENFGGSSLNTFTLEQDLDSVFGAGNYSINTALTFVDDPGSLTLNGGFDGSGDTSIIGAGTLVGADTAQIRLVVSVDTLSDVGNGFGSYSNQVTISAQAPLGSPTEDVSDDGTDPDPDGDGNPRGTNESDVTNFVISNAAIGSALDIKVEAGVVTLDYYLENLGNGVAIDELSLVHSLDTLFGSSNYSIISGPEIVGEQRNVSVNEAYDGSGNTELLESGSSIAAGETHQIQVVASINNVINNGTYTTSVTVNGTDPLDAPISDTSDMGTDPDSDGNKIADEAGNNDPTTFGIPVITSANLSAMGATGNSGIYIVGDTLIATWDNTASGDNNALTVQSVVFDFTAFGGSNAVPAINSGDTWQASMTIVEDGGGVIEQGGLNFSALVTLDTGDSNKLSSVVNLSIDNNSPVISGVSIPNQTFKVGDSIPVSISITDLSANLTTGLVNSVSVTNFISLGAGSYSADYLVQEGDNDVTALNDVPVSFSVTDNAGNASATYTTAIAQNADNIDANTPTGHSISFDSIVNLTNQNSAAVSFANVEVGTSYSITVSSSGGATTEVVTGSVSSPSQQVSGIDLSNVEDGTLTASAIITDSAGNIATSVTNTIIKDTSAPTVDISIPSVDQNSAFSATITFSESVTGFVESDITVANATLSGFSGSGASYSVTVTPDSDGLVTLDVVAASAQDANGNDNSAASQVSVKYDATAPTTTITFPSVTQIAAFTATIEFSEAVTGFTQSDINVGNATLSGFAGAGDSYSVTVTPTSNGTVTLNVAGGVAQDSAGNNNTAALEVRVEFDGTSPTTTIVVPNTPQNSAFTATVNFGESVNNFALNDVAASNAGLSDFSGSGSSYSFTVTPTSDGVVTLDVAAGVAQDDAGNDNTAAVTASVDYDATSPTATITVPTTAQNSVFSGTVHFSESVSGFDISDIVVTNASLSNFIGTNDTYTFDVTPSSDGIVTFNVNTGAAQDVAGNYNSAAVVKSVNYDATVPTAVINLPTGVQSSSFTATVTFSEAVTGFTVDDIDITNAKLSSFVGNGASYSVLVSPVSDGSVSLLIASGSAKDLANNGNAQSQPVSVEYDATQPSVVISGPSNDQKGEFNIQITFSENVSGFDLTALTVVNATLSNLSGTGTIYTAAVAPISDDNITVQVVADTAQDIAGNTNTASNIFSVAADLTKPTVTLTSSSKLVNGPFNIKAQFSENVSGLTQADWEVQNASINDIRPISASSYQLSLIPKNPGKINISLGADAVIDSAGNGNIASEMLTLDYSNKHVSAAITAPEVTNKEFVATIEFGTDVTGFEINDIVVTNALLSSLVRKSASLYTVNVNPSTIGEVTLHIPENIAVDEFGNGNIESEKVIVNFDNQAPNVVSRIPTNNSDNVSIYSDFAITFDESIVLNSGEIKLVNLTDNSVVIASNVNVVSNSLEFAFNGDLSVKTRYQLILDPAIVSDEFGNAVDAIADWFFTTSNIAPLAENDNAVTQEDSAVIIDVAANDSDSDGQLDLGSIQLSQPSNGTVFVKGSGLVEYKPTQDFNGIDSFTYTIADNSGVRSNEATVSVEITSVNDAPKFVSKPLTSVGILTEYQYQTEVSDVDSENLTVTKVSGPDWLSLNDQLLQGTVPASANGQSFEITLEVSDGELAEQQHFTLKIVEFDESLVSIVQGVNVSPILVQETFELSIMISNASTQSIALEQLSVAIEGVEVVSTASGCTLNENAYLCQDVANIDAEESLKLLFTLRGEIAGELNSAVVLNYNQELTKQDTFVQTVVEDVSDEKGNKLPLSDVNSFALADFNNDGLVDIAFAANSNSAIFINQGAGKYELGTSFLANEDVKHVSVADFNNDGALDIAFAAESDLGSGVLYNDGNLVFTDTQIVSLIPSQWVFTFDINADALNDIILLDDSDNGISIFTQPFAVSSLLDNTVRQSTAVTESEAGFNDLATGDFNSDGLIDLVLAVDDGPVEIWYQDGNGQFDIQQTKLLNVTKLKVLDINADGILEVVAITEQGLEILDVNNQELQRVSSVNYLSFDIAYLNGYQSPEIVALSESGNISIFEFTPEGYVLLPVVFEAKQGQNIALTDVDLDGDLDLIISSSNGDNEVRFNQGNGMFGEQTTDLALVSSLESISLREGDSFDWNLVVSNQGLASAINPEVMITSDNMVISEVESELLTCSVLDAGVICQYDGELVVGQETGITVSLLANNLGIASVNAYVSNFKVDDNQDNNITQLAFDVSAKPPVVKPEPPKKKSSGGGSYLLVIVIFFLLRRVK